MILLVKSGGEAAMPAWRAAFAEADPRLDVRWWDDPAVRPEGVAYVLAWDPEPGRLARLPNLRVVFGTGAGVDGIVRDPDLPPHLPVVRLGGPEVARRMADYVAWACLSLLRDARAMALAQAEARWLDLDSATTSLERRVGVMGLGNLGTAAARSLLGLGFEVSGWSRAPRAVEGVATFAGPGERDVFLARSDLLVCLLPSTPETVGVLGAGLFAALPRGAGVVNAARGDQLVVRDLLAALDSGYLSGAVLDVFAGEPLPPDSPLWSHPRVTVTPHCASLATRAERARYVAAAIAAHESGGPLPNLYDRARGY